MPAEEPSTRDSAVPLYLVVVPARREKGWLKEETASARLERSEWLYLLLCSSGEKIPFVGIKMCKMHSMVSYFYYRCILQHFAKSINILYGTNALLAAFIFKAFSYRFANRFHSHLWLLSGVAGGTQATVEGGSCTLPIKPP